ncbi:PREDICTED: GDAP2 homolog [Prunus dulcis]|uniref:PREDICTED: GDAP2 homolog n=1 Tax=Prunus dulcis TaxID=3755 RepID=A0A5E4ESN5_PRUDU|nr:PREDICTED: GDAP2 homolog [Prunus dulcis]
MGLLMLNVRQVDPPTSPDFPMQIHNLVLESESGGRVGVKDEPEIKSKRKSNSCATVEEMGKDFKGGFWEESLRVRKLIQHHFDLNGASHARNLRLEQFCHHGFVMGKASEWCSIEYTFKPVPDHWANQAYWGKFSFGDYISYSNGNPWNLEVDAVVNSTNENMVEAQCITGLHAAAGPGLAEECAALMLIFLYSRVEEEEEVKKGSVGA